MEGAAAHLPDPSSLFYLPGNHSCSTYANGHYNIGSDTADFAFNEGVRRQTERCDLLSGMDITMSGAGGAGSGMGSLFVMRNYEEYRHKYVAVNLLCPTIPELRRQSDAPATLGIYNHILS